MEKLTFERIRKTYLPGDIILSEGSESSLAKPIIGQSRAIRALQFGLGNHAPGFNIFVAGVPGTGKQTAVLHYLTDLAKKEVPPNDWCYVINFDDPYTPRVLTLRKGMAKILKADVHRFLLEANAALVKVFEGEDYARKRDDLLKNLQTEENTLFSNLSVQAQKENLAIKKTPGEILAIPLKDGRPMTDQEFLELSGEERDRIVEKQEDLKKDMREIARQSHQLQTNYARVLDEMEQKMASFTLETLLETLLKKYADEADVLRFLAEMKADLLSHLKDFLQFNGGKALQTPPEILRKEDNIPRRYEINVLVDNSLTEGAPIVLETNPTHSNLFGKIDKENYMGLLITDFTLIRSGSLHKANGGYLILPIMELLRNMFSWDSLKRALRRRSIEIEEPGDQFGWITSKSLKPDPVPLQVQVVLIGRPIMYYLLYEYDEDFKELFKVKADFDVSMDTDVENITDFIAFIRHVCQQENLLPLDSGAMAKLLEHSHRLAENQEKISTRFGEIIDIVREAYHYAHKENREQTGAENIQNAILQRTLRSNLLEEKIQEMIKNNQIVIDVAGEKTGQVNGISVITLGDISFGRPNRITATVSIGDAGIVDIEREAELGGPIHSKGVMILSGFLAQTFGQDKPIALSANLVFEQSYSEVEGDSASSAELYALLSSLSGLPLRQGIAVTGSVNQRGEVQAVGGINEKVEGFFDVCRIKGLDGNQGVVVPAANIKNLMLKEAVVEAVREGRFHLWAVANIGEGIEILTGVPAGKPLPPQPSGETGFEKNTVFDLANRRLTEMLKIIKKTMLPEKSKWLGRELLKKSKMEELPPA